MKAYLKKISLLLLLILSIVITGCASRIETVKVNLDTLQTEGPGVEGVVYYPPKLVQVRYGFTQRINADGKVVGTLDDKTCVLAIQKEEIITLPDYQNPQAVLHKPSWFATSKFGVSLDKGMLVSVSAESTPQTPQLLEQIISGASTVSTIAAAAFWASPENALPACNASPVIIHKKAVTLDE